MTPLLAAAGCARERWPCCRLLSGADTGAGQRSTTQTVPPPGGRRALLLRRAARVRGGRLGPRHPCHVGPKTGRETCRPPSGDAGPQEIRPAPTATARQRMEEPAYTLHTTVPPPGFPMDLEGDALERSMRHLMDRRPYCHGAGNGSCKRGAKCMYRHGPEEIVDQWEEVSVGVTTCGWWFFPPLSDVLDSLAGTTSEGECLVESTRDMNLGGDVYLAVTMRTPTRATSTASIGPQHPDGGVRFCGVDRWSDDRRLANKPFLCHATSLAVGLRFLNGSAPLACDGAFGKGVYAFEAQSAAAWDLDMSHNHCLAQSGGYHRGCIVVFKCRGRTFNIGSSPVETHEPIPFGCVEYAKRKQVCAHPSTLTLAGLMLHKDALRDDLQSIALNAGVAQDPVIALRHLIERIPRQEFAAYRSRLITVLRSLGYNTYDAPVQDAGGAPTPVEDPAGRPSRAPAGLKERSRSRDA